jgi:hypothetical protein
LGISNQCGVNMAFIGNTVTTQGFTPAIDYFNGDGTTTAFTLSRPVASVAQVQVVVNNVPQLPGTAYTVSGSTITFTGAPSSGTSNIYVYYTSPITQVIAPSQGTVGTSAFASSTGSGAVVLQTSPTVTTPTIDTITSAASTALTLKSAGTTALTIDTLQNVGIGTTSPTTAADIVRSNTSGNDNQMPNLFVRNTSATQGNGSSTFNQAIVGVSAGNSTVSGGIRSAYDSAGSYGTGMQLYVNSTNPLQFYTNGSERARVNSSGQLIMASSTYGLNGQLQVGITANTGSMNSLISVAGDQNGGYPIGVRGNSTTQGLLGFFDSSNSTVGSITKSGSNVAYNTSSDYRLKENLQPMQNALATVAQLKPVTYNWKADGSDGQGFIAHELQAVVPDCVTGEKDAVDADGNPVYQGVDTSFLVATLTAAIQELKAIVDAQAVEIEALKGAK